MNTKPQTSNNKQSMLNVKQITGLGTAATKNVGTGSGDVAAGNHNHDGVYVKLTNSGELRVSLDNWVTKSQTVTVTGVTASSTNLVVLSDAANADLWAAAKIYATGQATNSITFSCVNVPTDDIYVTIIILK